MQIECSTENSPKGNNQYNKHPFGLPNTKTSDFIQNVYMKYFQDDVKEPISNLPQFSSETPYVYPAGVYNLNKFRADPDKFPPYFPDGLFKVTCFFRTEDVTKCTSVFILRIFTK